MVNDKRKPLRREPCDGTHTVLEFARVRRVCALLVTDE